MYIDIRCDSRWRRWRCDTWCHYEVIITRCQHYSPFSRLAMKSLILNISHSKNVGRVVSFLEMSCDGYCVCVCEDHCFYEIQSSIIALCFFCICSLVEIWFVSLYFWCPYPPTFIGHRFVEAGICSFWSIGGQSTWFSRSRTGGPKSLEKRAELEIDGSTSGQRR